MAGWGTLFRNIAVFALLTVAVYFVCMWMVRLEDRRTARKGPRL